MRFLLNTFIVIAVLSGNRAEADCQSDLAGLISIAEASKAIQSQKELVASEIWQPLLAEFYSQVDSFKKPIAHGTRTGYLRSILETGLGSAKPSTSFSPGFNSYTDLKMKDGLLAAYAFATRLDTSSFSVSAQNITKRDIVQRYAEVNPIFKSWIKQLGLRYIGKKYAEKRGTEDGDPVLLVFDAKDSLSDLKYHNPKVIPSELETGQLLTADHLRFVFVPAAKLYATQALLLKLNLNAKALPIELIELEEIQDFAKSK